MTEAATPLSPQQTADKVREGMFRNDRASKWLGMQVAEVTPGRAVLTMTVRDEMLNGHDICHGGLIATLADSAFAFACNSYNEFTVASGFAHRPAGAGPPGRRAHRHLPRGVEGRPHRRVRLRGQQPARPAHRGVPRPLAHRQGQAGGGRLSPQNKTRRTPMPVKHPEPGDLEPIERASRDELQSLQLQRLQHTLQHAYENVPHYRQAFDAAGVHPSDCKSLADLAKFPFTTKKRPARQLPLRHVRRAARAGGARARQLGHHRQADGGGLHAEATSTPGPTWWRARSAPPAAAPATWCTWPTATACSPAGWARTTAPSGWAAR